MSQRWFDLVRAHKNYLDFPSKYQPIELAFHNIRTLFRFRCFENLLSHPKRRDSEWLWDTVGYDFALQQFSHIDPVQTRKQLRSSGYRSVVLGSFRCSLGWLQ